MAVADTLVAIQSLIQPQKRQACTGGKLSVEETGKQATLRAVHIVGVGATAFAIKYDACGFPGSALFAPHASMHRACDMVAFCEVDGDPFILCMELKSSEPTRQRWPSNFAMRTVF